MRNAQTASRESSEKPLRHQTELTDAELDAVSGGGMRKSSGGNAAGKIYLVFNFKLVAV